MHPYKQPVNIHHSIAFIVSFYCFSLSRYLGLIAVHDFEISLLLKVTILVKATIISSHKNTELEKQ